MVVLISLFVVAIMISLLVYFPVTKTIIFNFLGPIVTMALFVGIFLLFSGLFQENEESLKKESLKKE